MKNIIKYPYLLSLSVSFLSILLIWKLGLIDLKTDYEPFSSEGSPSISQSVDLPEISETADPSEDQTADQETLPNSQTNDPLISANTDHSAFPAFYTADRSYFDDALFIGDSRTVGLYEYGDLGNAVVLADSGMSIYKISTQAFRLKSGEKVTLSQLISEKQFKKIYLMLGINELGYSYELNIKRFQELITEIRTKQPDAYFFLEANLHVTQKKSDSSDIYNNEKIDQFNRALEEMATENLLIYLDINELFDDDSGNLSEEYTADETHVLGKYYADWVDWLLAHAV